MVLHALAASPPNNNAASSPIRESPLAEPAAESTSIDAAMVSEEKPTVDMTKEEVQEEASEQPGEDAQAMAE